MRPGLLALLSAALLACSPPSPPSSHPTPPVPPLTAEPGHASPQTPTSSPTSQPTGSAGAPSPSASVRAAAREGDEGTELPAPKSVLPEIRTQAVRVAALVRTPEAKRFLAQAPTLPTIAPRTLYHDADKSHYYSAEEAGALPAAVRAKLKPRLADEELYYYTGYGSPLSYARALDLAFSKGVTLPAGSKVLDFGYGYVGHLRMLGAMGIEATGVDVHPLLRALYSAPTDQGEVTGADGAKGRVRLIDGFFPRDAAVVSAVGAGYRLVISKNVLKKGYIHPERPADDDLLIHLGAADDVVLASFFRALEPGGFMLLYNICPGPTPADKPFVPWSDGRSPFSKAQWKAAGFKVLAFDQDDTKKLRAFARALEWDKGEEAMDLEHDLVVLYTLVRRPAR